MTTTELRIGNLLVTLNEEPEIITIDEIDGIAKSVMGSGLFDIKLCDLSSIPLTEEWLFKLGGSRIDEWGEFIFDGRHYYFDKDKAQLFREEWTYNSGIEESDWLTFGEPILYVHSFQNLHFALTGIELILK